MCGYGGSLSCETHPPFRRFVGSEGDEGFEEQHRQLFLQMLYLRTEDPPEVHEVPSWKHVIFDGGQKILGQMLSAETLLEKLHGSHCCRGDRQIRYVSFREGSFVLIQLINASSQ